LKLGVVVADVSGQGVPASLIMAICRSVLRTEARGNVSAAEVLRRVNAELYPDIKEDMFISMAYLILDADSGHATLAHVERLAHREARRRSHVSQDGG
jgi:sigma-B regulation protein RsbU (phosphoserine phosphatase)